MFNAHLHRKITELEMVIRDKNGIINYGAYEIAGLREKVNEHLQGEIRALSAEKDRFVTFFDRIVNWKKNQAYCVGELHDMVEAVGGNAFEEDL